LVIFPAQEGKQEIIDLKVKNGGITGKYDISDGGVPFGFVSKVIGTTVFIKSGRPNSPGSIEDVTPFSDQKAKPIRFSDYGFPVFVIRKVSQRNSYSRGNEGVIDSLKFPEVNAPL